MTDHDHRILQCRISDLKRRMIGIQLALDDGNEAALIDKLTMLEHHAGATKDKAKQAFYDPYTPALILDAQITNHGNGHSSLQL